MIFDDVPNIVANEWVHIQHLDWPSLKQAWYSGTSSDLGRPIAMLSFGINYAFGGLDPWGYKLVNLCLHLINGLLVYVLLSGIARSPALRPGNHPPPVWLRILPLVVTTAWLINPINVTSVLYVVQRMTELAMLFTLLGMASYVYLRLRLNTIIAEKKRTALALVIAGSSVLFTSLALLSKETGALLPLYLLLTEAIFFRFRFAGQGDRRRFVIGFLIAVGIPALAVAWVLVFHGHTITDGYAQRNFTLGQRLLTETRVMITYVKMMIVPATPDYGLYHDDFRLSTGLLSPVDTLFSALALLVSSLAALFSTRKSPLVSFGILFFLASHSIESTVISLELMHEHRNYPGSLGIMLALFTVLLNTGHWRATKRIRQILAAAFLTLFAMVTHERASIWGNPVLHAFNLQHNHPESARSALGAAQILAELVRRDPEAQQGLLATTNAILQRSRSADPDNPSLESANILLRWFTGDAVSERQLRSLQTALKKHSYRASSTSVLRLLVRCRRQDDCPIDHEQMTTLFQAALDNPAITGKQRALIASLVSQYAFEVMHNKNIGFEHQKLAILFDPKEPRHTLNLIRRYISVRDYQTAQSLLNTYMHSEQGTHSPVINQGLQDIINRSLENLPPNNDRHQRPDNRHSGTQ